MSNVKTAISIEKPLFERAEKVAQKKKISRSRLFALAVEDYLQREQNRELLAKINDAYSDGLDPDESELLVKIRSTQRRVAKDEW